MNSNYILAIDPSLTATGYAVFDSNQKIIHLNEITTNTKEHISIRLFNIYNNIRNIIIQYEPKHIIIERMFINMNFESSMNLAAVRGILLLLAGEFNIQVTEPIATTIRKVIMHNGRASKEQIREYIRSLLIEQYESLIIETISHNIIDAIAVGMYFFEINN